MLAEYFKSYATANGYFCSRQERRRLVASIKPFINSLSDKLSNIFIEKELTGSDESRQCHSEMTHASCLAKKCGRVLIEIGLREEIQCYIKGKNEYVVAKFIYSETICASFLFFLSK
jgi:hypothetical protein